MDGEPYLNIVVEILLLRSQDLVRFFSEKAVEGLHCGLEVMVVEQGLLECFGRSKVKQGF